jgi:hypothetical protein
MRQNQRNDAQLATQLHIHGCNEKEMTSERLTIGRHKGSEV